MDFYVNRETDPAFNLALEESLAGRCNREFFMLWRNRPSIIVGCNQNTLSEIDHDFVRAQNIGVVRRITGGGAVYHDLGNLNYTIAVDGRCSQTAEFALHAAPVVNALRRLGFDAEFSGRNDILVEGRKVSGSARSVLRSRTLFHGTMLFDVDLGVLEQALRPDPEKIRSKGIRSVRARVMNLRELRPDWSMEQFIANFSAALRRELGDAAETPVPPEMLAAARILADEKYRTPQWNFGTQLPYAFFKRRRFPCGSVSVEYSSSGNRITSLRICGDFFGSRPVAELETLLTGVSPQRESLAAALGSVAPGIYIQGISSEELLSLFD